MHEVTANLGWLTHHHRAGRGVTTYDELDELESTCTPHDVRRMSDMKLHRWRSLHACRAPRAQRWTVALARQQTGFTVLAAVSLESTWAVW